MTMNEPVMIRRTPAIAARVRAILGLPDDAWNDLTVAFGHDQVASATVTLFLTTEQLIALADIAGGTLP